MIRKTILAAVLLSAPLGSCGDSPAMKAEEAKDDSDMTALGPVPTKAAEQELGVQQSRLEGCTARQSHYKSIGVWKSGGVKPIVDREAWNAMSDAARDEIFEIAACLASSGKKGPQEITVGAEDFDGPVETRTVANQTDWSSPT